MSGEEGGYLMSFGRVTPAAGARRLMMDPLRLEVKPEAMWERRRGYVFTFRYPNICTPVNRNSDFCQAPFLQHWEHRACCRHWQVSHAVDLIAICICRTSFRLGTDRRHPEEQNTLTHASTPPMQEKRKRTSSLSRQRPRTPRTRAHDKIPPQTPVNPGQTKMQEITRTTQTYNHTYHMPKKKKKLTFEPDRRHTSNPTKPCHRISMPLTRGISTTPPGNPTSLLSSSARHVDVRRRARQP